MTKFLILIIIGAATYFGMCFVLDAMIRQQEFNDNIRFARCERMDEIERSAMKEYCR